MNNAVIYARFSSSNQREESIEGQVRECTERAKQQGFNVVKIYRDAGISGTAVDKREAFLEMIEESKLGFFQRVYVYKYDRFARNVADSNIYEKKLLENGVELVAVKEETPDGASGFLVKGMHELLAEYYSVNLSENVRRGHKTNALKQKHNGSKTYGYTRSDTGYYEIVEHEAEAVRLMYTMYASGSSMVEIREALTPYDTGNNYKWNISRIARILRNPKYKGTYIYDDIQEDDAMPAIVDKELWEDVQYKIANNKHCQGRKKDDVYPLSKKLFDVHGNTYVGTSGTSHNGKIHYYYRNTKTRKSIRRDYVDTAVSDAITKAFVERPQLIDEIVKAVLDEQEILLKEEAAATRNAINKIKGLTTKINSLVDAICVGGDIPELLERLQSLREEKEKLEQIVATHKDKFISEDMIRYALCDLRDKIAPLYLAEPLIKGVIILDNQGVVVVFNFEHDDPDPDDFKRFVQSNDWSAITYQTSCLIFEAARFLFKKGAAH